MNLTNSALSQFHLTKQQWYEKFGSSLTLDSLVLFVATPISLAGIVLNSISFYVLSNKKFESKIIFSYLRVYTFNSLLMCLLISTQFNMTYNFFEMNNSFLMRAYSSLVYIPLVTILAFFSGFLDLLISVERLIGFYPHIKKPTSLNSCFILLLIVLVITLPYFFIYYPTHLDANLGQNETFRLHFIGMSEFGQSSIGVVVNTMLFFIKDILTFLVEVVLNVMLVVLLRNHLNKKALKIKNGSSAINNNQPSQSPPQSSTQQSPSPNRSSRIIFRSASKNSKNKTVMVIVICVFSGFAHITTIMCNTSLVFGQNSLSYGFCFTANFFLSFKNFSNFFIFLLFNNLFYAEVKHILGIHSTRERNAT